MAEIESANFYLTSSTATSISSLGSTIIFRNFNIRECLGDLYNKYTRFKIVLNSVCSYNTNAFSPSYTAIRMSGLDFVNCYDHFTDSRTIATLGLCLMSSNTAGVRKNTQTPSINGCDFNKPSNQQVDLTIYLFDLIGNRISTTNNYGNNNTFCFTIYGIK